ncbi:MAG: hypothetical protein LQ351_006148 [Letrouitia transgressa]|nr:MAG: hypothetical protein LQ351_006148 [Letrouitia transgressa]
MATDAGAIDTYTDRMERHATEAERMDDQFRLITRALGWMLHPSISQSLGKNPSIADFATGTGLFLRSLAKSYPDAHLDGYDISDAMFPSDCPNVNFTVANLKEPSPVSLHGLYDLIHVRWLTAAMNPEDWELCVQNLIPLLKPGGAIQWSEPDWTTMGHIRGEPDSRTTTMTDLSATFRSGALAPRLRHGWSTLPDIMRKTGLTRVETDLVSSDRDPEIRKPLTENGLIALLGYVRMMAAKGVPGAIPTAKINELEKMSKDEIKSGCYVRYDIHTAVGFKSN